MEYSSVVLGWKSSHEQEAFECCAVPTLVSLEDSMSSGEQSLEGAYPSPTKPKHNKKRRGLMRFFHGRRCKEYASSDTAGDPVFPIESLIQVECKEPVFDDGRDDYICESRNQSTAGDGVECILPKIEYQNDSDTPFDECMSLLIPGYQLATSPCGRPIAQDDGLCTDDPWSAAKKGDLMVLRKFGEIGHNWKLEDAFNCTPLYYACQSGAASPNGIPALQYLLDEWNGQIPPNVFIRCKENAINPHVVRLLEGTQGSLCGVIVDTEPILPKPLQDFFGGWGGDWLYGEELDDDFDNKSDVTVSVSSGYLPAAKPTEKVMGENDSLTYSECSRFSTVSNHSGAGNDTS